MDDRFDFLIGLVQLKLMLNILLYREESKEWQQEMTYCAILESVGRE
jgi:hypothetical protein